MTTLDPGALTPPMFTPDDETVLGFLARFACPIVCTGEGSDWHAECVKKAELALAVLRGPHFVQDATDEHWSVARMDDLGLVSSHLAGGIGSGGEERCRRVIEDGLFEKHRPVPVLVRQTVRTVSIANRGPWRLAEQQPTPKEHS